MLEVSLHQTQVVKKIAGQCKVNKAKKKPKKWPPEVNTRARETDDESYETAYSKEKQYIEDNLFENRPAQWFGSSCAYYESSSALFWSGMFLE